MSFEELRNVSSRSVFSKVLEDFMLEEIQYNPRQPKWQ